jgi:ribosomal subunit interface protein
VEIRIRGTDVEVSEDLRTHMERRLGFALSRFGEKIGRVAVQFSSAIEKASPQLQRCQVSVRLRRAVQVQDFDADLFAAANHAADRAARSVAHLLELERQWMESPLRKVKVKTKGRRKPAEV